MKVVINSCYGGFGISHKAMMLYAERKGITLFSYQEEGFPWWNYRTVPREEYEVLLAIDTAEPPRIGRYEASNSVCFMDRDISRDDPILVQVVEELGSEADDRHASLRIVDIPDGINWHIEEYDGIEHVAEDHETWG